MNRCNCQLGITSKSDTVNTSFVAPCHVSKNVLYVGKTLANLIDKLLLGESKDLLCSSGDPLCELLHLTKVWCGSESRALVLELNTFIKFPKKAKNLGWQNAGILDACSSPCLGFFFNVPVNFLYFLWSLQRILVLDFLTAIHLGLLLCIPL